METGRKTKEVGRKKKWMKEIERRKKNNEPGCT